MQRVASWETGDWFKGVAVQNRCKMIARLDDDEQIEHVGLINGFVAEFLLVTLRDARICCAFQTGAFLSGV